MIPILGVLTLWQALALAGWLPDYIVPPHVIVREMARLLASGELLVHARDSLIRAYLGFVLGAGLGTILGLMAGTVRGVASFLNPLVSLTYPIPKVAVLPLFVVWFGIGDTSKVMIILLACFYPAFISALYGAGAVPPRYVWAARNTGAGRWRIFWRVIVPASAGHWFAGLRIGLALAFVLLFAAEMVGARSGLGFLIISAEASVRFDLMFVAIATIAILGFASDRLLEWVHRRLLHWEPEGERA